MCAVGYERPRFHEVTFAKDRGQPLAKRKREDARAVGNDKLIYSNIKCVSSSLEILESGPDIVSPTDSEWSNFEVKPASLGLRLAHFEYRLSVVSIKQDGQSAELRYSLTQQFQPLARKLVRLDRQSGGVAARFRQTCDQTAADRIDRHCKYDGNRRRRLPYNGDGASDR